MKQFKLCELFDLQMGKTPARNESRYWKNGVYPWISISDMTSNGKFIENTKEKITNDAVRETGIKPIFNGTVIMSFKLSIGKIARVSTKSYSNEAIMAFEIKDREPSEYSIANDYAYYLLSSLHLDNYGNRAVMGITLNKGLLENIIVDIHSWKKQREIVCILDKMQNIIDNRKVQLTKLDELIKARFVEMFGDILHSNYEKKKLYEIANIGSSKRIYANEYTNEGIPFYRSKEIRELGSGEQPSIELYISEERYSEIKEKFGIPSVGDILIAAIGATIGYMWVIDTDKPFYYKDGNLILIANLKSCNSIFMQEVLRQLIEDYKNKGAAGSAQLALTIEKVEKMEVPVPPLELQNQFADFVKQVDKSKAAVRKNLEKAQLLFDSLMQKYFS